MISSKLVLMSYIPSLPNSMGLIKINICIIFITFVNVGFGLKQLYNPRMEPFRTLINESNYLNDFLQFQIIKTEEQIMLPSQTNEFLLMKIVIEDLNYTQSYKNVSSDDFLELEARIRNGV